MPITLPTHKFGIELEVSGISPQMATDAINRVGVDAVNETYNHRTRNHWKVTTDSSIQSENGLSCEIVSPILTFGRQSTVLTITKVVNALINAGAKVNESCGFHVHVNCQGITDPDFFRTLLSLYANCEEEIDNFMLSSRRKDENRYCRSNQELFNNWGRFWSNFIDPTNGSSNLNTVFADVARYYKLNFNSYTRHGTVEFRQLQGTLNLQKILGWVAFCVAIVNQTNDFVQDNKSKFAYVEPSNVNRFKPIPAIAYIGKIPGNLDNFSEIFQQNGGFEHVNEKLSVIDKSVITKYYKNALFSNKQTNSIYKLLMAMVSHYSHTESQIVSQIAIGRRRDDGYRELNFAYNTPKERQEMHNAITALFFGYSGTEEELTRKTNAKLKNVGLRYNTNQSRILLTNEQKMFVLDITSNVTRDTSGYYPRPSNDDDIGFLYGKPELMNLQYSRRVKTMKNFISHFAMVANAFTSNAPNTTVYYSRGNNRTWPSNLTAEMCKLAIRLRLLMLDAFIESYAHRTGVHEDFMRTKNKFFDSVESWYEHKNDMFEKTYQNCFTYTSIPKDVYVDVAKNIRESSGVIEVFELMKSYSEQDDNQAPKVEEPQRTPVSRRVVFNTESNVGWTALTTEEERLEAVNQAMSDAVSQIAQAPASQPTVRWSFTQEDARWSMPTTWTSSNVTVNSSGGTVNRAARYIAGNAGTASPYTFNISDVVVRTEE